jgi:hypothetical protein
MMVALALVATSALAITCYQEDSSIPNQTGIDTPNCGLNYSGSIVYFAEPTINPLTGVINDTWVKPPHARDTSQFKFQVSINGNQTTSIPLDCYYYDPTAIHYQLRTQLTFGQGGAVDVLCFNGTGYSVLFHTTCVGNGLPGFGSPTLAYDGNWSTYVWYESYPVSNWMTYPNYPTNPETGCAIWDSAMDWDVCIPNWQCSGYGICNTSDQQRCIVATDANNCNETYTGDYSEFAPQTCDYCTPDFHCTSLSSCFQFDMERHCNGLQYVADRNNCYPQTNLTSDQFSGSLSIFDTSNCSEYSPVYSTADMGKMLIDMLGNIAVAVLGLVGCAVLVLLTLYLFGRVEKGIKGENK